MIKKAGSGYFNNNTDQTSISSRPNSRNIKNKGLVAGLIAQRAFCNLISDTLSQPIYDKYYKVTNITNKQYDQIKNIIPKIVENTGLKDKGVEVLYAKPFPYYYKNDVLEKLPQVIPDKAKKTIKKFFDSNLGKFTKKVSESEICDPIKQKFSSSLFKKAAFAIAPSQSDIEIQEAVYGTLYKKLFNNKLGTNYKQNNILNNLVLSKSIVPIKNGNNACFISIVNKIILPEEDLGMSAFHEIGHALNSNMGTISKKLQAVRILGKLVPPIVAFIAFTNKRKVHDETHKDDSKIQKSKDFIKRNAGKIASLSFVPVVVEEAVATIKGNKLAQQNLPNELAQKVKTSNFLALATYINKCAIIGIALCAAIKVKDFIQGEYEQKQMKKAQKQ